MIAFELGLAGNQNADIFDDFWQRRTQMYLMYFKREFDKKRENCGVLARFVLFRAGIPSRSQKIIKKCALFGAPHFCGEEIAANAAKVFARQTTEIVLDRTLMGV